MTAEPSPEALAESVARLTILAKRFAKNANEVRDPGYAEALKQRGDDLYLVLNHIAALTDPAMVLVPREPTEAMRKAGFDTLELNYPFAGYNNGTEARDALYRAMIAAALTTSAGTGET